MSEFKLNVSVKIGDKQLTARSDSEEELESNMSYLMETFGKDPSSVKKPVLDDSSESQDESYCYIHDITMKERDGQYGKFYSHYIGKYPDGSWCTGKEK